jgi:hypothetical protein
MTCERIHELMHQRSLAYRHRLDSYPTLDQAHLEALP